MVQINIPSFIFPLDLGCFIVLHFFSGSFAGLELGGYFNHFFVILWPGRKEKQ